MTLNANFGFGNACSPDTGLPTAFALDIMAWVGRLPHRFISCEQFKGKALIYKISTLHDVLVVGDD